MAVPAMKRYEFTDFAVWADTANESIDDFAKDFGFHPNIMCASAVVWRAIDDAVQSDLDNVVTPYPAFLLVFDEDQTFDGEPEPVGEEEETIVAAVPYAL